MFCRRLFHDIGDCWTCSGDNRSKCPRNGSSKLCDWIDARYDPPIPSMCSYDPSIVETYLLLVLTQSDSFTSGAWVEVEAVVVRVRVPLPIRWSCISTSSDPSLHPSIPTSSELPLLGSESVSSLDLDAAETDAFEQVVEGKVALSGGLLLAGRGKASSNPLPKTATYRTPPGTGAVLDTLAAQPAAADVAALSTGIASASAEGCSSAVV